VSAGGRRALLLVALAALGFALAWGLIGLFDFGAYPGPYGIVLQHIVVGQRHVTELVGAATFDYRGIDTLGEEFILLTAVVGCTILLRTRRAEREREADGDPARLETPEPTFAMRSLGAALVGPVLVLGMYLVAHGHISPGGGFQGGVVLAGALLAAFAAEQSLRLRGVREESALEVAEAAGALGFAALAVGGLIAGAAAVGNFLPLGSAGMLLSGGTIPVGNVVVGLEVTGAVALVMSEFLDQALLSPDRE
jgi:multicomponent Na+:H+ antiporter subunit B